MTVKTAPILEPLLKSPKLSLYARQLQDYLDEEQQRREAFYDWTTEDIKAEFINGEIVMQTPAKQRHTVASMNLAALLDAYVEHHQLGFVGAETVLIALTRNDYLPDVCFFSAEKAEQIMPDQVKFPAPDFIIEVLSPGTESTDRGVKFEEYAASHVHEYWLVDPDGQTVEQYLRRGDAYELIVKIKSGEINSEVVAGFTVPVAAIFDRRLKNQALANILAHS